MSNTKTVMGQASNQYVVPTDITDVFSTYLYTGTGSAQTITNGIDLDGEGGLVWFKMRNAGFGHRLVDTERGVTKKLESYNTAAEGTEAQGLTAFNSNGFTVGSHDNYNANTYDFASWTFRKAPKFFDVVTWTGTGSAQNISHDLGSVPGMIIVKRTSATEDWLVYHRSTGNQAGTGLNETAATYTGVGNVYWNSTDPTDSVFTVGTHDRVNTSGQTYVAYLFAHNDGDGGFGPDGSDIIKCGSFTTDGSGLATVDLGFEPQFLIRRMVSGGNTWNRNWDMYDIMRGITMNNDYVLEANTSDAEASMGNQQNLTPTGFTVHESTVNQTFIYMAIRRGPLAPPESATEVFKPLKRNELSTEIMPTNTGFATDLVIHKPRLSAAIPWFWASRLQGDDLALSSNGTNAEASYAGIIGDGMWKFDSNDGAYIGAGGYYNNNDGFNDPNVSYSFLRAPGFFDAVAYTGTGSVMTVNHNLGVAPEMMWVKCRSNAKDWAVYHSDLGSTNEVRLNSTFASFGTTAWNNTTPTDSAFTLGVIGRVNSAANEDYIAYLFASLPGISKVGSWTMTSGDNNIDCGFTSGARFVLIKDASAAGVWLVWDSLRGIVAGNDPYLELNSTNAEYTTYDYIDPLSSGFTITSSYANFYAGNTYIFYAIA
jgi:hypothetical protein